MESSLLRVRKEVHVLENPHVFRHGRKGHVEVLGEVGYRAPLSAHTSEDFATGLTRERTEESVEASPPFVNHMVDNTGECQNCQLLG